MKLEPINRCPRYLPDSIVNSLPTSLKETYTVAKIKFRFSWNRYKQSLSFSKNAQFVAPTQSVMTREMIYYGNWLKQVYDIFSGCKKLLPADRTILEHKVSQWAETNKPDSFTEDFEEWEKNNILTEHISGIKDPLSEVANFLEGK
ncbi:MAG: hypothetical protein WC976_06395 [Caldisericia bacterium]